MDIYLYYLLQDGVVKYVGLTRDTVKRKGEHRRKFPEHEFVIKEIFSDVKQATQAEVHHIAEHSTYTKYDCWNKSPGGDYDHYTGYNRKGIGGYFKPGNTPWNKGLDKTDPRVRENSLKSAKTKRERGYYETCGKTLPKLIGEKNHMKTSEHRKRMSELASRRYRVYKEDGTWTWGYHPPL